VGDEYSDTASLVSITDSTIMFKVNNKNVYTVRSYTSGQAIGRVKDTVLLSFAVLSKDSTRSYVVENHLDILKEKTVRNKLFFNILKDTISWHIKKSITSSDFTLTIEDIRAGFMYGDLVELYFNDVKLNTSNDRANCAGVFNDSDPYIGDCYFNFGPDFYNDNKGLGLSNGFYTITMKEKKTGLPIVEKRGKKGAYVKFVE
jgi:hypothetical protein